MSGKSTQDTNQTQTTNQNTNLTQNQTQNLTQEQIQNLTQTQQQAQQSALQQQQAQTQAQQGVVGPYAQATPTIDAILAQLQGQVGNTGVNPTEQNAFSQLMANANSGDAGAGADQAQALVSKYFGGDPQGLLQPALAAYQNSVNPIANASLDPRSDPGIQSLLDSVRSDVSNQVNGLFAGAGRDLSGKHQEYLGRGIASAEAPILLDQYNRNVAARQGAAGGLLNAAGQTAGAMGGNQQTALNFADIASQLRNAGPTQVLAIQQALRNLPVGALGALSGIAVPIAGLGQTSSQTGVGTTAGTQTGSQTGTATGTQAGTMLGTQAGTMSGTQQGTMSGVTNTQGQTTTTQPWSQTWAQFMSPFQWNFGGGGGGSK